jgi:uncharacterized membrane-anchored protein YitT (DUF2179 family)
MIVFKTEERVTFVFGGLLLLLLFAVFRFETFLGTRAIPISIIFSFILWSFQRWAPSPFSRSSSITANAYVAAAGARPSMLYQPI